MFFKDLPFLASLVWSFEGWESKPGVRRHCRRDWSFLKRDADEIGLCWRSLLAGGLIFSRNTSCFLKCNRLCPFLSCPAVCYSRKNFSFLRLLDFQGLSFQSLKSKLKCMALWKSPRLLIWELCCKKVVTVIKFLSLGHLVLTALNFCKWHKNVKIPDLCQMQQKTAGGKSKW